jgi:hypothetical protein
MPRPLHGGGIKINHRTKIFQKHLNLKWKCHFKNIHILTFFRIYRILIILQILYPVFFLVPHDGTEQYKVHYLECTGSGIVPKPIGK